MAAAKQHATVVGVFDDRAKADKAVADLMKAGFRQDQIGIAMRYGDEGEHSVVAGDADDTQAGSGALTGALTGLGLGTLAGLGVLAGIIPVVGPAIAAGTLGVVLSNAAAGAGIAGLVGALIGAGIPENEAEFYHQEFEAGRVIVTVQAGARGDDAMTLMRRHGAYDMSTRGSTTTLESDARSGVAARTKSVGREGDTIEVKEERLHASKRPVNTGEVTVRKEVHTETKSIDVPIEREEVVIERTPVRGRKTSESISADALHEGEQIRIPVREEQVKVSKDVVVTEEVKVGKRVVHDTERVSGTVRKEEVKVEQKGDVNIKTRGTGKGPKS